MVDFFGQDVYDRCVLVLICFQFLNPLRQILVAGDEFTKLNEGTNDEDVHLYGPLALEHRREHGYAVLGEDIG